MASGAACSPMSVEKFGHTILEKFGRTFEEDGLNLMLSDPAVFNALAAGHTIKRELTG